MFTAALDRLGGLFDRRFIVADWGPLFVVLSLLAATTAYVYNWPRAVNSWTSLSGVEQLLLEFGALLTVTVLAHILQAFTAPIIRLYEGHGLRSRLRPLWANASDQQRKAKSDLKAERPRRPWRLLFPTNTESVRPTRLGNALTASEEYPNQVYRLDGVTWWPRLLPLLPDALVEQLSAAYTLIAALVNLSFLLALYTAAAAVLMFLTGHLVLFLTILVGGPFLSWLCYSASINRAVNYGGLQRASYDLYRHKILTAMRIPPPANLAEERTIWEELNSLVMEYVPPWDVRSTTPALYPFDYADVPEPPADGA